MTDDYLSRWIEERRDDPGFGIVVVHRYDGNPFPSFGLKVIRKHRRLGLTTTTPLLVRISAGQLNRELDKLTSLYARYNYSIVQIMHWSFLPIEWKQQTEEWLRDRIWVYKLRDQEESNGNSGGTRKAD